MIKAFLLSNLFKYIIIAILAIYGAFSGYNMIKDSGYNEAKAYYEPIIQKYNNEQIAKVAAVEGLVQGLVSNNQAFNASLTADIAGIKDGLKGKTLVIYKDGKCSVAKEFLDSRDRAIDRANQK